MPRGPFPKIIPHFMFSLIDEPHREDSEPTLARTSCLSLGRSLGLSVCWSPEGSMGWVGDSLVSAHGCADRHVLSLVLCPPL